MVINVVNSFRSQASKTFDKSKICCNVQVGERFSSVDVSFGLGKKLFKFGTTTVVDIKAKSFEDVKSVRSSSLLNESVNVRAGKQNIVSKVKSARNNITKLFKFSGRGLATVPAVDPFVAPAFDNCSTADYSSTLLPPPIVQHPWFDAPVATASESIPHSRPSLEATGSPLASGKNVADESIEDLAFDFCGIVEVLSPSSTGQLFVTPVSPSDALSSTSLLNVQLTTKEEDGITLAVVNTNQGGLTSPASRISWSSSGSEVTVYFSSDSLSAPSTASEAGLVSSETKPSAIATSFATSVDAQDDHQPLPTAPRGLRRIPNYEDLRNLQAISNRDFSCSDVSSGASYNDVSDGANSSIHAIPLHGYVQCDNLRKSFLPFEHKICTSSIRQTNKFEKLRAWLITRCHEASHNTWRMSAARVHSERRKVISVSPGRQFLQGVFRPSSRIRGHVSKPAYQPLPPSSLPIWSCAKITRSSSKTKRRRRMTKQSMRELKARLDSMDIDPSPDRLSLTQ